ncbi:GNAT family N-acetyltransferase [Allobacillus sp. GCM10007491]|uniref:GNAT family N-acetyltransferase n=1 Tax=Allobacillus saliphilus TaxID=2912308 RepID=A0A941CWN1_9BACI|nr:GNAT family N-acetyltransferase [Allobacillus saliphilus]MBR7555004.1 GNAT family N-acetyltransferase [Allobacillus saliphilus]
MEIREIEIKDNQAMESIIKRSLESFKLDIPGTAYFDPQLGELAQFYAQEKDASYWVAVNEAEEVVGGVGMASFDREQQVCELQKLYVKPEYQGQGIAVKLMSVALAFAEKHYDYCYLETSKKLEAANRLYSWFGFDQLDQPFGQSSHFTMDAWYMKDLRQGIDKS